MKQLITIERHILEEQQYYPEATGVFTSLMYDLALAAKLIARETTRAGLADILGRAGSVNIQGEEQQKLDVYANQTIIRLLDHAGRVAIMASEEHEEPIPIPERYHAGNYAVLFDPLDGSSNIDYNSSIGTIFSVHRKVSDHERGSLADLLQPGYRQVAAGYVIYGSSTMMVYSAGRGVHGFTLDPSLGEFLLSHPNIRIPDTYQYYSVNQGYEIFWSEGVRRYVKWLVGRDEDNPSKPLSLRYVGSLVADFHRTLLSGGVFMYPADSQNPKKPHGKLRLTYECAPLAFVAQQAGGYASDGIQSILNIQPHSLHQRTPFFVGNRVLVEKAEEYIRQYDAAWVEQYKRDLYEAEDLAFNGRRDDTAS
ncbi:MAG: class 1 fructose-bisphosphatase [Anaerolineae bacterium]